MDQLGKGVAVSLSSCRKGHRLVICDHFFTFPVDGAGR
jgi:hypothetical protein